MSTDDQRIDLELTYIKNPDGSKAPSLPDDLRQAAINFTRENARRPASEIVALIDTGHQRMVEALAGMSEAQAAFKPSPDDWSVLELLSHTVATKTVLGTLMAGLAKGELPPGFGAEIETQSAQDGFIMSKFDSLAAARAAAEQAHAAIVGVVRGMDGDVNTDLQFKHYIFGPFNCREWAVFQRVHDDNHAPQVDQIKASHGFPAA